MTVCRVLHYEYRAQNKKIKNEKQREKNDWDMSSKNPAATVVLMISLPSRWEVVRVSLPLNTSQSVIVIEFFVTFLLN